MKTLDRHGLPERRPRREARGHRRRRLQGRRDLRERPAVLQRHARRRARAWSRTSGSRSSPSSRSAISRACPADKRERALRARRAQVRPDAGARLRSPAGLLATSRRTCLGGIDRAAADLHELGERAAKRGLRVGFEALAWGRHINDYRDAWEVVRRADHPAVGLVLDSFHILARKTDLERHPLDPARPHLPGAGRRRAACSTWTTCRGAGTSATFPGQGDLPLRRLHGGAAGDRLSTACSRWRSSTTSSAPARRAASPSTAIARCSILLDQLRARTGAPRRPAAARCRRARSASASSSSSSPSTRPAPSRFETAAARASASAGPACTSRRR